MTPDYVPDPTRFTNNPNDVIALLSIICVLLVLALIWIMREWLKDGRENKQIQLKNIEVLNKIYGAMNDKE